MAIVIVVDQLMMNTDGSTYMLCLGGHCRQFPEQDIGCSSSESFQYKEQSLFMSGERPRNFISVSLVSILSSNDTNFEDDYAYNTKNQSMGATLTPTRATTL